MNMKPRDNPSIEEVMTPFTYTVNQNCPIGEAETIMLEKEIRHLPVQDAGGVVGLISERDIRTTQTITKDRNVPVGLIMTKPVYTVTRQTKLDAVALTMSQEKYGCSIIVDEATGQAIGIFTLTDAVRELFKMIWRS